MADAKTAEKTFEQTYGRVEEMMTTAFENNRQAVQSFVELQRNMITAGWDFFRTVQDETYRVSDAMVEQTLKFQKSAYKTTQDATNRFQELTEKTVRDNNERLNQSLDQSLEMVSSMAKKRRG